jgi:hypothetical protein
VPASKKTSRLPHIQKTAHSCTLVFHREHEHMRGEPTLGVAILFNTAAAIVFLVAIASVPVGMYYVTRGARWGLVLGGVAFVVGLVIARLLFKAGYRGEDPNWRRDGVSVKDPDERGVHTLL